MEKRFTAKTEDNSISDAPDRKAGLVLLIISGVIILVICFAVAAAVKINKNAKATQTTAESTSQSVTETTKADVPVEYFGGTYPDGTPDERAGKGVYAENSIEVYEAGKVPADDIGQFDPSSQGTPLYTLVSGSYFGPESYGKKGGGA